MNISTAILASVGFGWFVMQVTFLFYLAIMNAIRVRDDIPWAAWVFLAPVVIVGVLFDVLMNVVLATVMFLDPPKEFMFTKRLQRYRETQQGSKREKVACFFCEKILNVFDPTRKHC